MIRRLGDVFTRLAHRWMPHPFVFALGLTVVTFVLGFFWGGKTPGELADAWYDGFWTGPLMIFALQMALILVTGHALAETRAVRFLLDRFARLARGTASAVVVTALVAMTAALFNWGLGLIVGALLARAVARSARDRGVAVHYPLVVAAGYTGLLVWHGGLSGSAPVSIATVGHPLETEIGLVPIRETILSPINVWVTGFLLVAVPTLLALMAPGRGAAIEEAPRSRAPPRDRDRPDPRPPDGAEPDPGRDPRTRRTRRARGPVPAGGNRGDQSQFDDLPVPDPRIDPPRISDPLRAQRGRRGPGRGGILLQFPFYFGIMGLMRGAGLIEKFAELFVSWTGTLAQTGLPASSAYSMLTFLSAGLVNLFVPSGGGQWAVQGPIAVEAAARLGAELPVVVMALAYGDQLTNMLQPFWALPLLAITGLEARHIVGYTALLMLLVTPGILLLLAILAA